jgi:hypothetical protein
MSLRDFGVFFPLKEDHPLVIDQDKCAKCGITFAPGMRTALMPIQTPEESGSFTVETKPICATCHMRGVRVFVETHAGDHRQARHRIVDRIKDGDGSPFPVITMDGCEWKESEIFIPEASNKSYFVSPGYEGDHI